MVTTFHSETPARFVRDYCALWFCVFVTRFSDALLLDPHAPARRRGERF